MRKLIIHIGAHKTGSTAIQKFFYDYHEYFEDTFGLIYPVKDQVDPEFGFWGQHYLTWYFTPPPEGFDLNTTNTAFKSFLEIISENKKDVLISSEDFTWNDKIDQFVNHVRKYFDEILVIMYVRIQVEAALSLYQTAIINYNYAESFQQWFDEAKSLFDYYAIANRWETLGCRVIVKPYIREQFDNKDIILDFLNTISQALGRKISAPHEYKPDSIKMNISLPDFITMMVRYYNSQPSKDKVVPILKELGLKLIELLPDLPKYDFVPASIKKNVLEIYKESNRLLCENYLGLEYLNWLNQEIQEEEEKFYKRFGYPGGRLVELAQAVIRILEKH